MNKSKRDELAEQHGNGIANPVLRSMICSMSRGSYALVLSDSFKAGYDAGYAEAQVLLSIMNEALLWADEMLTARDEMNSKVHCAPVRLSPITERVKSALEQYKKENEK